MPVTADLTGVGDGVGDSVGDSVGVVVCIVVVVVVVVVVGVAVPVTAGGGVIVLETTRVGVGGADWAVSVAATRVATIPSKVDVTACVGTGDGSTVFVNAGDPVQLVKKNMMSSKKLILVFMAELPLQSH